MNSYAAQLAALHHAVTQGDTVPLMPLLKPGSRPEIYSAGYRQRLCGAVIADYPALAHFMGEAALSTWAQRFVAASVPMQRDLNRYSIAFAAYLSTEMPESAAASIATLESALVETFWQPESEPVTAHEFAALSEESLAESRFTLRTASKLLTLTHNANTYLAAFRNGTPTQEMEEGPYRLLVLRHHHEIHRIPLELAEHEILTALESGKSFAEAIESNSTTEEVHPADLSRYIGRWLEYGIVCKK